MSNELTHLKTQKAIDEAVNKLVAKSYSISVFSVVLTLVSISVPEARQEIVNSLKFLIDSEANKVESK